MRSSSSTNACTWEKWSVIYVSTVCQVSPEKRDPPDVHLPPKKKKNYPRVAVNYIHQSRYTYTYPNYVLTPPPVYKDPLALKPTLARVRLKIKQVYVYGVDIYIYI